MPGNHGWYGKHKGWNQLLETSLPWTSGEVHMIHKSSLSHPELFECTYLLMVYIYIFKIDITIINIDTFTFRVGACNVSYYIDSFNYIFFTTCLQ